MKDERIGTASYRNAEGTWMLLPIIHGGEHLHIANKLPYTASDAEVGRAQRDMLQWCDEKYVKDLKTCPQVKATGLKSWMQFCKQWLAVRVDFTATDITVWPSMRLRAGAYQFLHALRVTLPLDVDDATLGAAVRAASEQCAVEGKRGVSGMAALETGDEKPDSVNMPQSFGYKCMWLAVKSTDPKAVAKQLRFTGVRKSTWEKGIEVAYEEDERAFISPPLDGWVLVVSCSLPSPGEEEPPDVLLILRALSREFGEAQYFCTHRVAELHAWAKAVEGEIVRAYGYSGEMGEVFWDEGELTPEEQALGLVFSQLPEPEDETPNTAERIPMRQALAFIEEAIAKEQPLSPPTAEEEEDTDERMPDEEDVLALAAKWSIDTSFSNNTYAPAPGLIGSINFEKLAKLK